jgi:hypothetical protein
MTGGLRYVEGIGLRPHGGGLDVVGGGRTARLKGSPRRTATTLRIVELIRAGAAPPEIAERLGEPVEAVRARVASLGRVGALTEVPAPPPDAPPQLARFLERTLGPEHAAVALDRLARATVHVAGDGELAGAVAELLHGCGVRTVDAATAGAQPPALVVACGPPVPRTSPTLLLSATADAVVVGPLCQVPGGRCAACLPGWAAGRADPVARRVGAAYAVAEAVRYLARTGYCRTAGGVTRVGAGGRDMGYEPVARDPACPYCGLSGAALPGVAAAAYRSLQSVDVPLRPNWEYPLAPLDSSDADSTIKVLPVPGGRADFRDRPDADRAIGIVTRVLATGPRAASGRVPSVGGANLLNVFLCGATGAGLRLYSLDRRRGTLRPVPVAGPQLRPLAPAGPLTVVVAATLSRAENLFGSRAGLTIHQDTGFAMAALGRAVAAGGLRAVPRRAPGGLPDRLVHALGLDPARDAVTAILEVVPDPRAGRTTRSAGQSDRDAVAAAVAAGRADGTAVYVRDRDGLFEVTPDGWRAAPTPYHELDTALADRGLDPAVLVVFAGDLRQALAAYGADAAGTLANEHAQAAQRVSAVARRRGLDALILADLPSTALAPDGRGWRTGYRSFAAVALGAAGTLPGADDPAVRW